MANIFDSYVDRKLKEREAPRLADIATKDIDPDKFARAIPIAKQKGVTPNAILTDLEGFESSVRLEERQRIIDADPILQRWASNPDHMAVAKDDLPALSGLSQALGRVPGLSGLASAISSAGDKADKGSAIGDTFTASRKNVTASLGFDLADRWAKGVRQWGEFDADIADAIGLSGHAKNRRAGAEKTATQFESIRNTQLQTAGAYADATSNIRQKEGTNRVMKTALDVTASMPQFAATTAASLLTSPLGGMVVSQRMSASQQLAEYAQDGKLTTNERMSAELGGVVEGAFDAVAGKIFKAGLGPTLEGFSKVFGKNVAARLSGTIAKASKANPAIRTMIVGGTEAGMEAGTTALQMAIEEAFGVRDYSLSDYANAGVDSAFAGGAMGVGGYAATKPFRMAQAEADKHRQQRDREVMDGIMGAADGSLTKQRSPESLAAFVGQASESTVYVPAEKVQALFQGVDDPQAAFEDLTGETGSWVEAIASDAPVAIPLRNFVSKLNPQQYATLADSLTVDWIMPDPETAPTAEEMKAEQEQALKEMRPDALQGIERTVYDQVVQGASQVFGDQHGRDVANIWTSTFRAISKRTGIPVETLHERFRPDVNHVREMSRKQWARDMDLKMGGLINDALTGKRHAVKPGARLSSVVKKMGGLFAGGKEAGDLRAQDVLKQMPGLLSEGGKGADDIANIIANEYPELAQLFDSFARDDTTVDGESFTIDFQEFMDKLTDDVNGREVRAIHSPESPEGRKQAWNDDADTVAKILESMKAEGLDPVTMDPSERQRTVMERFAEMNDPEFGNFGFDGAVDGLAQGRVVSTVGFPDVVIAGEHGSLAKHEDYKAAKAGDAAAAVRVAEQVIDDAFVDRVKAAIGNESPIIVPVLADESSGDNAIPLAAGKVLARQLGLSVSHDLVQIDKVSRTGRDGFHRLANPPAFDGEVQTGQSYLILDDTVAQGATLAQLRSYIESNGGRVILATALSGKAYSAKLAISGEQQAQLRDQFSELEGWWKSRFGHGLDGLTASEANYILKLKPKPTFEQLRDRIIAATHESKESGNRSNPQQSSLKQAALSGFFNVSDYRPEVVSWAQNRWGDQEAPNGRPIWQNFVQWFGDSKVVDAEGKPLVVYHGTNADFDTFELSRIGLNGRALGPGFYFTNAEAVAGGYGQRMIGAYMKLDNPILSASKRTITKAQVIKIISDMEKLDEYFLSNYGDISYEGRAHVLALALDDLYETAESDADVIGAIINVGGIDREDVMRSVMNRTKKDGIIAKAEIASQSVTDSDRIFVALDSTQIKSATGNQGDFNPDNASILKQSANSDSNRGQLTWHDEGGTRYFNIETFAKADPSTLPHEMAHAFLEIQMSIAQTNEQMAKELQTVQDWWWEKADHILEVMPAELREKVTEAGGRDFVRQIAEGFAADWSGHSEGSLERDVHTQLHEYFARGFESYLRTGKAPSTNLTRIFDRFKQLLIGIYKQAKALRVELTPDMEAYFSRMLATDQEIEDARDHAAMNLPWDEMLRPSIGDKAADGLRDMIQMSRIEGESELVQEQYRIEQKRANAERSGKRREIRRDVEASVREMPVYRAMRILKTGKDWNGNEFPAIKFDRESLSIAVGEGTLRTTFKGMYKLRKNGGMPMDSVARLLGYDSVDSLLREIIAADPIKTEIANRTDAVMDEKYPRDVQNLTERAVSAVHGKRQSELIGATLNALRKKAGSAPVMREAVKNAARAQIAGTRVGSLRPDRFEQAEGKFSRLAFKAAEKGNWREASEHLFSALLNHELYRESRRAKADMEKYGRYLRNMTLNKRRSKIGKAAPHLLEIMDSLLDGFDFQNRSMKSVEEIMSSAEANGIDLPEMDGTPYKAATVQQIRDLRNAVKQIEVMARNHNKIMHEGQMIDVGEARQAVADSIRKNGKTRDGKSKLRKGLLEIRAFLGGGHNIARQLDGFEDFGPVYDLIVKPIRHAIWNEVNPRTEAAAAKQAEIYKKHYTKTDLAKFRKESLLHDENGNSLDMWSKEQVLSLALNWGNNGNVDALLEQARDGLTKWQYGQVLKTMDARDWKFVQDTWAHIDSYWPDIQKTERRRKGFAPEKVEARGFEATLSDGKVIWIEGGYYPLKYDGERSAGARGHEADEFYESIRSGGFSKAATRNGHTKERTKSGGNVVRLDLGVIDQHLRGVIRDLYLGDAVNAVHQVLSGHRVKNALIETANNPLGDELEAWLKDAATGEMMGGSGVENIARDARKNFTAAVLTWKATTAMLQITGISQSSVVLGRANMMRGLARALGTEGQRSYDYVYSRSPFMKTRLQGHIDTVQEVIDGRKGRVASARDTMIRWGYIPIGRVQSIVDVATWLAAEQVGFEKFGDPDKAAHYADDIVSRSQGSGEFVDKNAVQRGNFGRKVSQSELVRLTATLLGYIYTKHNAVVERSILAGKSIDGVNAKSALAAGVWAADMAQLFIFEAFLSTLIRGGLTDDDDKDGDGLLDEWVAKLGGMALSDMFGVVPMLGSVTNELQGFDAKSPVDNAYASIFKFGQQVAQGENDPGLRRATVNMAGTLTGAPASQINKSWDALDAYRAGEDVNAMEAIAGVPKSKRQNEY